MFASQTTSGEETDINFYTSSVVDHINTCIDNVTTVKHVKHFPNQKPWMNSEVCLLLKARDAAFKSGNAEDYSRARANLKRSIRKAKHAHKLRIEEHFHGNSDPRCMWKGIQSITDHKPSIQSLPINNAFLPDVLNHFFAHFDKGIIHHTRNAESSTVAHLISLSTTEAQATVPTCLKTTTIIPVPKHSSAKCLNNFHPVALSPIVMKCFEKLVLSHLIACLPPTLDPHQFAYRPNSWIMDFLTNRPQSVSLGNHISSTLILNTGIPQDCVLSPLLYSLFTHDCVLQYNSNIFIKYADDTTVVGRISNNDELAYREEIQSLSALCSMNNLTLNATKTKELIVDFWKSNSGRHPSIYINGSEVEHVSSFKFLGIHISEDLSWYLNISTLVRKAQQRLYFLGRLKKAHLSPKILSNFYRCIIESILMSPITVCLRCLEG
ncbi:hypothetical protein QTP70_009959 [Hemibagrus guttatus]|uniref:Reverse transcriptase domain-containing protein n=1 Tax=Hemibagrus guttatus TaxID=175788 RepID=A0AAE0QPU8_9TELE|nr:hypothetical protein QTP70_009959 [Hemibagrus guttatus]